MTFDYVLGRAGSTARVCFTVEADVRWEADVYLVERMRRAGYSWVDFLYWSIICVTEVGRRP